MTNVDQHYKKMTETPVAKLILNLGIPTTISMLITNIYNMADTYFVGMQGESAQAATGVLFTVQAIMQGIAFMLGHGGGTFIARALADKNTTEATKYISSVFYAGGLIGLLITVLGTSLVTSVLAIVLVVFEYIALYDVFKSCEPSNAVAFLIISILFQIALPILLFVSRKKDLGMPPRKQEAACIQEESQTTWEENQAEDVE